jgi:peptidoglycan/xylan/chitin deacetylase (PgdA/CDA1 family)
VRRLALLCFLFSLPCAAQRTVALTFDDLPVTGARDLGSARSITDRLLAALARHRAPAIGFVIESQLQVSGERDARVALLERWIAAGLTLGNHTFSHLDLQTAPLWQFEDDVIRGEAVTGRLLEAHGGHLVYFRNPYNHTGATAALRDEFIAFLKLRGYASVPFTIEHSDWAFNGVYLRALEQGDDALARRIAAAYLDQLDVAFDYGERRSRELLGREPAQVLLVHANQINAVRLDQMLGKLERRGYRFVTLDEALRDPAYALKDGYAGPGGISWLHRWAIGMGQQNDIRNEPDPPKFILDLLKRSGQ